MPERAQHDQHHNADTRWTHLILMGCVACNLSSEIIRAGGVSPARAWLMHPRELHC